jgi:hypothetical protein
MSLKCARCQEELDESLFRKGQKLFKQCLPCRLGGRQRFKRAYEKNKPAVVARIEQWRKDNPEKHREIKARGARRYRALNPEVVSEQNKDYRRRNKGKVLALSRAREAHVARATPKWADLAPSSGSTSLRSACVLKGSRARGSRLPLRGKKCAGCTWPRICRSSRPQFNARKHNRTLTKIRHETGQELDKSATMPGMEVTDEMLEIAQLYVDRKITRSARGLRS